jgi:SAM-dependent methyltransferase
MPVVDEQRAITLGHPSYVWRAGQQRRLDLVRRYVELRDKVIVDIGCGLGMFTIRFAEFTPQAYGMDIDHPRVVEAHRRGASGGFVAVSEHMPLQPESVDVLFLNEVIEHVIDDRRTMEEAARVLKPGGSIVLYAPNRLYPFETHGAYFGRHYRFGNIPLINWLPDSVRNRLVPHARAYTRGDFERIFRGLPFQTVVWSYVYPGFDNVVARYGLAGRGLRSLLHFAESTALRNFGLSHFIVLRRS